MAYPSPLSLFDHWVAARAIQHHKVIGTAKRTAILDTPSAEAELTRQSVAFIEGLHTLGALWREYGDDLFATPDAPLTEEQKKPAQL